jgi:hypothetical protein
MGAPKLKLVTSDDRDDPRVVYAREETGGLGKLKHQVGSTFFSTVSGLIITCIVLGGIVAGNLLLKAIKPYLYPETSATSKNVGREMLALKDINIRETPGKESSANIVGRCGRGAKFQVLETNAPENWYRVKTTTKVTLKKHLPCLDEGWVYTENLQFLK